MPRHHVIISGTGRAGTTFLVQLLTELGLDTGFPDSRSGIFPNCNAGMEWDITAPNAPYIVKSPWLCDHLDEVLRNHNIQIDHALIPIRDLFSAAESRRDVTARTDPSTINHEIIPGGMWHTSDPDAQESVLAQQLYHLLHTIAEHDIPMSLLAFPRIVRDADYLFGKLEFLLGGISAENFHAAFQRVSQPDLVHDFEGRKRSA